LLPREVAFKAVPAKVLGGVGPEGVVPLFPENAGFGGEFVLAPEERHLFKIGKKFKPVVEVGLRKAGLGVGNEVPLLGPVDEDAPRRKAATDRAFGNVV